MSAGRFILAVTVLALLVALVVPPVDLPETAYNESDSPFVALQPLAVHLDHHTVAPQPAITSPLAISFHHPTSEWQVAVSSPTLHAASLPAALQVLLC